MKTTHSKRASSRQATAGRMTAKGREIVASLKEAIEVERSGVPIESRFTVRTVELPDEPGLYDAISVRGTRDKIGASQAIFAHLLGVSAMLVRAWEQGQLQTGSVGPPPSRRNQPRPAPLAINAAEGIVMTRRRMTIVKKSKWGTVARPDGTFNFNALTDDQTEKLFHESEAIGTDDVQPLTKAQRQLHAEARRRGRPRKGKGVEIVSLSIEKDLLHRAERLAKAQGLSRSDLFARGLRAVLAISGAA